MTYSGQDKFILFDTSATWDCSLASNKKAREQACPLGSEKFVLNINRGNVFNTCKHDIKRVKCGCPTRDEFLICFTCGLVFCCEKCATVKPYESVTK